MKISLSALLPVVQLQTCASDDTTRPQMCGVRFNLKTGLGEATDGHVIASRKADMSCVESQDREASDPEAVTIPNAALVALARVKAKDRHAAIVTITKEQTCLSLHGASQCWPNEIDRFPDTESIWPKEKSAEEKAEAGTLEVCFDAALLLAVATAMRNMESGKKHLGVRIRVTKDKYSPIEVFAGEAKALVMPMLL